MGGRRRSAANKPLPKRRPKLQKTFKCPHCAYEGITLTISKEGGKSQAYMMCKVCKHSHNYRKEVTYLTEGVDVYADWLDTHASKQRVAKRRNASSVSASSARSRRQEEDDELRDDDLLATPSFRKKSKKEEEEEEDEIEDEESEEDEEDDE